VELDRVPQRETGMTSYEIMLSESQERMLLVADKARAVEVLDVFSKWGLDASIVGEVTAEPRMRITQGGVLVADIANASLTDDAPVYHRPVGVWKAPVPVDPPAHVLEELKKPRDYTADLKKLLASANICDKRWVFEQYDSMVQTNTVQGPGGEAGVMRIKGTAKSHVGESEHGAPGVVEALAKSTPEGHAALHAEQSGKGERGLAMALAGNGRWTYLDPKLGAMHAVAEAARKVACTGATPVAATNCLNFGNPEKPEIMAQLSAAIDGIAEACTALGTPVTGGNVSLYNETKGEGIYPTPVLGVVGIIEDVGKSVPSSFQKAGDRVLLIEGKWESDSYPLQAFGSSDYAKTVLKAIWGRPEWFDLREAARLNACLIALGDASILNSAGDISDGGLAVALAKASFANNIGVNLDESRGTFSKPDQLFRELACSVIVSCSPQHEARVQKIAEEHDMNVSLLGETIEDDFEFSLGGKFAIRAKVEELRAAHSGALEAQLAAEVVTA
jgi:phosphoribosylformylglycinamidine synthase